jgi:4-amino-4-deoxy-L-arabinose transferase-like glycosyltransferase
MTLIVCFVAAAALRLLHLASKPFWFDECFSAELVRLDWRNFLHLLWWREANMSLYYLLLRAWSGLAPIGSQNEFFFRSLSVVASLLTLPAIYWLARQLYNRRVALITTVLFTANAYSVRYAQEARSYALFLLLATISSGFLIAWLRRPTRRNLRGYILASILTVYTHFYALLLVAAHWIALRYFGRPDLSQANLDPLSPGQEFDSAALAIQLRRAWKIIGLAVLPLLIFVAKTGAGPIRWIPRPGPRDVCRFFEHLTGSNNWPLLGIYALACLAAVARVATKLWTRDQGWETWRARFLLIWLLFPVALTVLLSLARPVFLGRYMIFCLSPLLILAAAGLARLGSSSFSQSWTLAVALTVMLFLSLQGISFIYGHDFDDERDGSGAASNFILDHTQARDGVLFHIAGARVPYEFFRSLRTGENTASPAFRHALGPEILFPIHGPGLDYRDFTGKPTAELLRAVAPDHPRLWLLLIDNGPPGKPDPTTVMLTQTLPELYPNVERWQFPRVEVRLYSR